MTTAIEPGYVFKGNFRDVNFLEHGGFFIFENVEREDYKFILITNVSEGFLDTEKILIECNYLDQDDINKYYTDEVRRYVGDTYNDNSMENRLVAIIDYYGSYDLTGDTGEIFTTYKAAIKELLSLGIEEVEIPHYYL